MENGICANIPVGWAQLDRTANTRKWHRPVRAERLRLIAVFADPSIGRNSNNKDNESFARHILVLFS